MGVDESTNDAVAMERQVLADAAGRGVVAKVKAYLRLSGPGWLQSALTLGGGSLTGSLYLGVLAGFSLLWLQPLAMIAGIVMLSAIAYVTLSTGERPFHAINRHINPVLGWGWALASLAANIVWAMPQFGLGTAAVRQNLLPGIVGPGAMEHDLAVGIVAGGILVICIAVVWFYDSGYRGVRFFETVLKIVVGIIVASFIGVVVAVSIRGDLNWAGVFAGLVPDINLLWSPSDSLKPVVEAAPEKWRTFWTTLIVADQRDVMLTAAATAVGINMTFLLPYSMLRRGWDRQFRGLAIFDLSTGLFIPFLIATSCVVIASAHQFHGQYDQRLTGEVAVAKGEVVPDNLQGGYNGLITKRLANEYGDEFKTMTKEAKDRLAKTLPLEERRLAAMLVRRDATNLAESLEPLTGRTIAQVIFGTGVVAMAISSIILMMLISGFIVCEIGGFKQGGWPHRLGTLIPAVSVIGPFVWTGTAKFWLAVPTSIFGMVLIPIAYLTFWLMINHGKLMGADRPRGMKMLGWNAILAVAFALAAFGSLWSIWDKGGPWGMAGLGAFIALALVVQFTRKVPASE